MKRVILFLVTIIFITGIISIIPPQYVFAKEQPNLFDVGLWEISNDRNDIGTVSDLDMSLNPAPEWLHLFSNGVKLTGPATICHPFRQGQFSWVSEIRRLTNGKWVKLDTVSDWQDGPESRFIACAKAPSEGVYALFGYYTGQPEIFGPVIPETPKVDCSAYTLIPGFTDNFDGTATITGITISPAPVVGTTASYSMLDVVAGFTFGGPTSGSGTTNASGVAAIPGTVTYGMGHWTATLRLQSMGCQKDYSISGPGLH